MQYAIGVGVVECGVRLRLVGRIRSRFFYPTLGTVIATYYILFAVMGNSTPALV